MVAIIGAGITGLTLGELLGRKGIDFRLYEASDRTGGNIQTLKEGKYTLEKGPNSLIMNNFLFEWLTGLGIQDQVIYASAAARKRYILKGGKYRSLPRGPLSLLTNSTLSWKAKMKLWNEPKQPREEIDNESIDHFFRRRLGDEVTDYLVYPFISGIYAGDPGALLVSEAFPNLVAWEQEYGSVLEGFIRSRKVKQHKGTFSFRQGLGKLVKVLTRKIEDCIYMKAEVKSIKPVGSEWKVTTEDGESQTYKYVVSTIPAHQLSKILTMEDEGFPDGLSRINYPPVSMAFMAYKKSAVGHPLDGFGALHSQLEESYSLGTIFSSTVFPGRCPDDEVLMTTFVGGALHLEKAQEGDVQIFEGVWEDHRRLLKVSEKPVFSHLIRWPRAIPQYDRDVLIVRGLQEKITRMGLFLGGNWTGGISVGSCIKHAHHLVEELEKRTKKK